MNQRLFHVGLKIPETRLWDLMAVIEKLGAGDIEIQHIPYEANEPVQLDSQDPVKLGPARLDPPTPVPAKIKGPNQTLVLSAMKPAVPTKPRTLTGATGLTPKQIHMALFHLLQLGAVKRPEIGIYVRIAA